jgi:hypothetical protein
LAKAATSTTPIVFVGSDDPVRFGLVSALNRPGGNVTGVTLFTSEIEVKKLELLSQLVPKARHIGIIINPNNAASPVDEDKLESAARLIGRDLKFVRIGNESEFEAGFESLRAAQIEALLVAHDPYLFSRRNQLIALAARCGLPAMYELREFPAARCRGARLAFVPWGVSVTWSRRLVDRSGLLPGGHRLRCRRPARPSGAVGRGWPLCPVGLCARRDPKRIGGHGQGGCTWR